jgi:nicotinamide phosphoribosyltransferase
MTNKMNSALLCDGYKLSHNKMYPEGTTLVFSNFTPRSDKYAPKACQDTGVVVFGIQMMLQMIHEHFAENFFKTVERAIYYDSPKRLSVLKRQVLIEIKTELDFYLGGDYDVTHFEELWNLGYLPIEVRALDEGTTCPIRVPMLTIHNTKPEFFWVTNYLETIISNLLWKPMTSATIAKAYKEILVAWANRTDKDNVGFVDWQGHDFSMRGMDSVDATVSSGLGHLTSFLGTDSLPAVWGARKYYGETGFVAGSVPATEHSVMCAGSKEDELGTFKRLMETYPTGILSVVSDTWDLWNVITNILPQLKEQILSRDGKLVIRPDSGNPVGIICGTGSKYKDLSKYFPEGEVLPEYFEDVLLDEVREDTPHGECGVSEYENTYVVRGKLYKAKIHNISWNRYDKQYYFIDMWEDAKITLEELQWKPSDKGVIELLWDIFGGTINEQGYKVLDLHIGAIYGDSITTDRAWEICQRLEAKGFASTNVVLGIGSFTYQYNTRDTFGFAMKATYVERDGKGFEIFKDPVTDSGMKKSAKGLLKVVQGENGYELVDQITWEEFQAEDNELKLVYLEGSFYNEKTLTEIRAKLNDR